MAAVAVAAVAGAYVILMTDCEVAAGGSVKSSVLVVVPLHAVVAGVVKLANVAGDRNGTGILIGSRGEPAYNMDDREGALGE